MSPLVYYWKNLIGISQSKEVVMQVIHAIYENGVFRPTTDVNLLAGTRVVIESEAAAAERIRAARRRVFETLGRSHDTGQDNNILETYNHHQA